MKKFIAGENENGVRLSRFVESVTRDMPRSLLALLALLFTLWH